MSHIHQINLSDGGVPKTAVDQAVVSESGIVGDRHNDNDHHGGVERALCLFSLEVIERFQNEGHPIEPGSGGEDLILAGLDWATLEPGNKLTVGPQVEIEITSYTAPCSNNADWFQNGDFTRMLQSHHLARRVFTQGFSLREPSQPATK